MIEIFGLQILQIHLEVIKTFAAVAGASTVLFGGLLIAWREWRGKAFDQFVLAKTIPGEKSFDGSTQLVFRDADRRERLGDAVRGLWNRRRMTRAAKKCTLGQAFVGLKNGKHQDIMHEAVRGALTRLNIAGEADELAGLPVVKSTILYAVTATDQDEGPTHMFRAMIMRPDWLERFHKENQVWVAPDGRKDHPRIATLRTMAHAYMENDGFACVNDRWIKIVDSFELKRPAYQPL